MPFCIRCEPADCPGFDSIISISVSLNSNFKTVDLKECQPTGLANTPNPPLDLDPSTITQPPGFISGDISSGSGGNSALSVINGPITGNISIVAYAFGQGQDVWNGSRCEGTASASQGVIQKADYFSDSLYLIPNDTTNAQIKGDVGNIASISDVIVTTEERRLQNLNGISIATRLGIEAGTSFSYTGLPLAVTMPDTDNFFNILDFKCCFLTSFSYSVNFPSQPAQATYNFQFIKNGAQNNGGKGTGNNGAGVIDLDIDTLQPTDIFAPVPNVSF